MESVEERRLTVAPYLIGHIFKFIYLNQQKGIEVINNCCKDSKLLKIVCFNPEEKYRIGCLNFSFIFKNIGNGYILNFNIKSNDEKRTIGHCSDSKRLEKDKSYRLNFDNFENLPSKITYKIIYEDLLYNKYEHELIINLKKIINRFSKDNIINNIDSSSYSSEYELENLITLKKPIVSVMK